MSATAMPAPRRRRWRRWLLWLMLVAIAFRLTLSLLLPWIVDQIAGGVGLSVSWRSSSLSLTGMSIAIEDLQVRARADSATAPPLLTAHRLHVDVAALALLTGGIRIVDTTVTGVRLHLDRRADGTFVLPAELVAGSPTAPLPTAPTAGPLTFDLPLVLERARLDDARVTVRDPDRGDELQVIADALVADLGDPQRDATIEMRLTSPGCLDRLHLHATARTTAARAGGDLQVQLRGARPASLLRWWPLAGIAAEAEALDADLHTTLAVERLATDATQAQLTGEVQLAVTADHAEVVGLPKLRLDLARWTRTGAGAVSVQLRDGAIQATRRADGAWVVAGLAIGADPAASPVPPFPLVLTGLSAELGPLQLAADAPATPFALRLALPGWLDELSISAATLRPVPLELTATMQARGLQVAKLQPWLAPAGIRCAWPTGDLAMTVRAAGTATTPTAWSASLHELELRHGSQSITVPEVGLVGLAADDHGLAIDAIRLRGPQLAITRTAAGAFELAGWEFTPPARAPTPPAAPAGPPPYLSVRQLDWSGAALTFTDATTTPPATLALAELALTGRDLAFGTSASTQGTAAFSCRVPGVIGQVSVDARVTPRASGGEFELTAQLGPIVGQGLRPWLLPAGIEPLLQQGELQGRLALHVEPQAAGIGVRAELADVALRDGGTTWIHLPTISVQDARVGDGATDLGSIAITGPELYLHRRADGGLDVAGLALPASVAPAAPAGDAPPPTVLPTFGWQGVSLRDGKVTFVDEASGSTRRVTAGLTTRIGTMRLARGAPPTPFTVGLTTGARARIACEGDFVGDPDALRLNAKLRADGLDAATMGPWLPADTTWTLGDGTADALLTAGLATRPDGTCGFAATLRDVVIADGDAPVFAIDLAEIDVPRLASDGSAVHVAKLQVAGLRTALARANGRLRVLGLLLPPGTAATPAATSPAPAAPLRLPGLQVDQVDLELAELLWTDEQAEPVRVSARVQSTEPWLSVANDLAASPPWTLRVRAAAAPLCREAEVAIDLLPFALEPRVNLTLRANGIDTTAVTRLWPRLQPTLQGELTDGTLTAKAELELDLRRRQPDQFDFARAFGGRLHLHDVRLTDAEQRLLAGVRGIEVDARTIDPQDGTVLLRSLEIDTPALHVVHAADGISCLGVRLLRPATATPAAVLTPAPARAAPRGELAIDSLLVAGLDVTLTDTTTDPPTVLPFDALDVEVQRWSSRASTEPRPFAFSASLRGGKVELQKRTVASSMLAGLVASAAQAVAGSADQGETEARVLLEELLVQGRLQLFPELHGRVQTSIAGLELPALRGLARGSGVEIGDGLFDANVTTELRGKEGNDVAARLLFTHLSLSEPPGGPISTYLKLPAPIDTVLFVLRNDADEQDIPFSFHLGDQGPAGGEVAGAAISALGAVIADAVAKSPLRAAGAVTGLLGLGGAPEDLTTWRRHVAFPPGEATLAAPSAELLQLAAKLAADEELTVVLEHVYGQADVPRLAGRANPPAETLHALATRLRQQKGELLAQRDALAATAEGQFAAGLQQQAVVTLGQLQALDERLGHAETALDKTLAHLRPGAERGAERRTRQAGRELGELRLQATADWLRAQLPAAAATRVEVRSPRWLVADQPGAVTLTPRRRLAQ